MRTANKHSATNAGKKASKLWLISGYRNDFSHAQSGHGMTVTEARRFAIRNDLVFYQIAPLRGGCGVRNYKRVNGEYVQSTLNEGANIRHFD